MSDSHSTIGTPEPSAGSGAGASGGVGPSVGGQPVKVVNPLKVPYRTGSYLIFDEGTSSNFRSAARLSPTHPGLAEQPYRASGSHQLDVAEFRSALAEVLKGANPTPTRIYLVDLREETHGFLDIDPPDGGKGIAVSWYADNDFANVGQTKDWITTDEAARLDALAHRPTQDTHPRTQVFELDTHAPDNRCQGRVEPKTYTEPGVAAAYNEAAVAKTLTRDLKRIVSYERIPVTDHCAPSDVALRDLRSLRAKTSTDPKCWVHFHCHGGDGRTTTFLVLYDMLCWNQSLKPLPSLTEFALRQCQLFHYCLDPDGCQSPGCHQDPKPCDEWKESLAEERWRKLDTFRNSLIRP